MIMLMAEPKGSGCVAGRGYGFDYRFDYYMSNLDGLK